MQPPRSEPLPLQARQGDALTMPCCAAFTSSAHSRVYGQVDEHGTHKLLNLWVVLSSGSAVALLAAKLWVGTGDWADPYAVILQLIVAAVFLLAFPRNPDRSWSSADRDTVFYCSALLLAIQFVKLIVSIQYGVETWFTTIELSINMAFYLLITAVPFLHLDLTPDKYYPAFGTVETAGESLLFNGYGWQMWALEAADATSLVIGFVRFAEPGMKADWDHHIEAFLYFVLVSGFLAGFLLISGIGLLGIYGCEACSWRHDRQMCSTLILALDFLTDMPLFLLTLYSRSYVGNIAFTFNAISNVIVLARAVAYSFTFQPSSSPSRAG